MTTTEVENFPGFPGGIDGPDLMDNMRKQAETFGAELVTDDVTEVDLSGPVKIVKVGQREYKARAVILATGSAWRRLGVPGENDLLGHGVSSCATCDGFFFRNKKIAVIGGGDSAMEEATFLTRFGDTVTIVHRRDEFRASQIMVDRAKSNEKIDFRVNNVPTEIIGKDGKVAGVLLKDTVTGEESVLDAEGVFIAIGHDPRSALFEGKVELDAEGYVKVDAPSSRTNVPGVFACGDLVDHTYRQAITAAGTGCVAALDAEHYVAALTA